MTQVSILNIAPFNTSTYWRQKFPDNAPFLKRQSTIQSAAKILMAFGVVGTVAAYSFALSAVPITAGAITFLFGLALYQKKEFPEDPEYHINKAKKEVAESSAVKEESFLELFKRFPEILDWHLDHACLSDFENGFRAICESAIITPIQIQKVKDKFVEFLKKQQSYVRVKASLLDLLQLNEEAKKILAPLFKVKVRKVIEKLSSAWIPIEKEIVEKRMLELPYETSKKTEQAQNIYRLVVEKRDSVITEKFPKACRGKDQTVTIASEDNLELKLINEWFLNYVSKSPYHRACQTIEDSHQISVNYTYNPNWHITDYAPEIIYNIFRYLNTKTLITLCSVDRQFRIWSEDAIVRRIGNHSLKSYRPLLPLILRHEKLKVICLTQQDVQECEFSVVNKLKNLSCDELDLTFGVGLENIVKLVSESFQLKSLKLSHLNNLYCNKFALGTEVSLDVISKPFIAQKVEFCLQEVFAALAKNKTLKELDLITANDIEDLRLKKSLSNIPLLTSLEVVKISSSFLNSVEDRIALATLTQLKVLHFHCSDGIIAISFLRNLINLEELYISNLRLRGSNYTSDQPPIPIVADLLPHLKSLHTLSLGLSYLDQSVVISRHIGSLNLALTKMKNLKNLSIKVREANFPLGAVIKNLINLSNIERFDFEGCRSYITMYIDFNSSSESNVKSKLQYIHLTGCELPCSHFSKMLNFCPSLPNLKELVVTSLKSSDHNISENDELANSLRKNLPYLHQLKKFHINCQHVSSLNSTFAEKIINTLQVLIEVEDLSITGLDIPENKIRTLLQNLIELPKIKRVSISKIIVTKNSKFDVLLDIPFTCTTYRSSSLYPGEDEVSIILEKVDPDSH